MTDTIPPPPPGYVLQPPQASASNIPPPPPGYVLQSAPADFSHVLGGATTVAQAPSVLQDLGRAAAMSGRAMAHGLADVPGIVWNPVAAGVNKLESVAGIDPAKYGLRPADQNVDYLLDKLGVPNPQPANGVERVVSGVDQALGGLAGGVGIGSAMKSLGGPLVRGIGEALTSHPTAQIAATGTGAASAGLAREGGAPVPVQAAAGLLGAGASALAPGAARTMALGARALVDPLTDAGQERILANTLARFGKGGSIGVAPSQVEGVAPTLAHATGNPGIAALQNAVADSDPALSAQFATRAAQNNAARLDSLRAVAGTPEQIAEAQARRDAVANLRYGQAFQDDASQRIAREANAASLADEAQNAAGVSVGRPAGAVDEALDAAKQSTAASPRLQVLAQRPAIQSAMARAVKLASNNGVNIGNPLESLEGLHYMKLGLDDMLNEGARQGIGGAEQGAIAGAKKALVNEIERQNPAYANARETYRAASGPIDTMKVGQAFLNRVSSPTADSLGNPVVTPAKMGQGLKSLDAIARSATGQKNAVGASVLGDANMGRLNAVMNDLNAANQVANASRANGSNTVRNLASQSLLGELSRSTGLRALASSPLMGRLAQPLDSFYRLFGAPDELRNRLGQVLLNPTSPRAQAVLKNKALVNAMFGQQPEPGELNRMMMTLADPAVLSVHPAKQVGQ